MPKKQYSDEQTAFALRPAETGTPVAEICRRSTRSFGRAGRSRRFVVGVKRESGAPERVLVPVSTA